MSDHDLRIAPSRHRGTYGVRAGFELRDALEDPTLLLDLLDAAVAQLLVQLGRGLAGDVESVNDVCAVVSRAAWASRSAVAASPRATASMLAS